MKMEELFKSGAYDSLIGTHVYYDKVENKITSIRYFARAKDDYVLYKADFTKLTAHWPHLKRIRKEIPGVNTSAWCSHMISTYKYYKIWPQGNLRQRWIHLPIEKNIK